MDNVLVGEVVCFFYFVWLLLGNCYVIILDYYGLMILYIEYEFCFIEVNF